jgi:hypothetical protein
MSELQLDGPIFAPYEKEPRCIITLLRSYHGDIQEYIRHFFTLDPEEVLSRTFCILNEKENASLRNQWQALTEAHEMAKIALTKRKALDVIANYSPTGDMDVSKFTTFARFWLSSHTAGETVRAKRLAGLEDAPADTQEREEILQSLQGDS